MNSRSNDNFNIERLEQRLLMAATARDPWREPFAADSIWNTPIGSAALYATPKWGNASVGYFDSDEEFLHFSNPGEPLKPIYQNTFGNRDADDAQNALATDGTATTGAVTFDNWTLTEI